jgi:hypothetical protein
MEQQQQPQHVHLMAQQQPLRLTWQQPLGAAA